MIEIENLPENTYGALTLDINYYDNPTECNNWNVVGNVHEDEDNNHFTWITEFEATKGKEIVYGNLEDKVYTTSQDAYDDFIKSCPPKSWSYTDNHLTKIILTRIDNIPKTIDGTITINMDNINQPDKCGGWDVLGEILHYGCLSLVKEFTAEKGDYIVLGNFEYGIYATSQEAYDDFIKNCPLDNRSYDHAGRINNDKKASRNITIYRMGDNYKLPPFEQEDIIQRKRTLI